jgi:hypothetical protein
MCVCLFAWLQHAYILHENVVLAKQACSVRRCLMPPLQVCRHAHVGMVQTDVDGVRALVLVPSREAQAKHRSKRKTITHTACACIKLQTVMVFVSWRVASAIRQAEQRQGSASKHHVVVFTRLLRAMRRKMIAYGLMTSFAGLGNGSRWQDRTVTAIRKGTILAPVNST